jgi:multidrug efflux system outer membrane protein
MRRRAALLAAALLLPSCIPDTPTAPPDAHLPGAYRDTAAQAPSIADLPWRSFYHDPVLQELVAKALLKNYTVNIAYESVRAAGESLTITHANQLPAASATVAAPYQFQTGDRPATAPAQAFAPELAINASYQIDLFGKLRSATAAARAQLLATQSAYETVVWTLVSQVATSYFQLRELDAILDLSRIAQQQREESLRLIKLKVQYGESSLQDQLQAEQGLYAVTSNIPVVQQGIAQTENALAVLTGDYPHAIERGLTLEKQIDLPEVPATGVPSALLARRPDIRQADATLVAADAQIDVARKLLLPAFTLGGSAAVAGQVSTGTFPNLPASLSSLGGGGTFYGPTGIFSVLPQLTQIIFSGGALQAQVRLSRDAQQQAVLAYLQAVQGAVRDVANATAAYRSQRAYRVQEQLDLAASQESTRLANLRYNEGQTSYLEVLYAQTQEYEADVNTQQALLNERLALVQLYLALGGGLEPPANISLQSTSPTK